MLHWRSISSLCWLIKEGRHLEFDLWAAICKAIMRWHSGIYIENCELKLSSLLGNVLGKLNFRATLASILPFVQCINSLKGFPKIWNCQDLYDHSHNGLYALEKDGVPAFICTSSRTVSWDTHQCHQLSPNLTNGVLGLYAEEKGWREVVDFVDTGLVLFASQVLRLEIAMQPKGQVPDGRKTLQIINWSTKFSIWWSLVFNVVIFVFFFSSRRRGNDKRALLGCFAGSTESLMCFSRSMMMMGWPFPFLKFLSNMNQSWSHSQTP